VLTDKTTSGYLRFYNRFTDFLKANPEAYAVNLEKHFTRHLEPFTKE
jgi:hypothetical protein